MENTSTKTLIVIPCLNEEKYLPSLIANLLQDNPLEESKIVIVDGGSSDASWTIIQDACQKHTDKVFGLQNPKRIQSAALNLAVRQFGHDANFLIRIDAHAEYPSKYCMTLLKDALNKSADAVVVSMETTGSKPFQKGVAAAQNSWLGTGGSAHRQLPTEGKWIDHGHHALMTISAFNLVGGYDESFAHNEDAELDFRLIKAGKKIWLTADTSLTYFARSSPLSLFRQYRGYGYGRAKTVLKHNMHPKIRQLAPAGIVPICILSIFGLFSPWASFPLLIWLAICLCNGGYLAYEANDLDLIWAGPATLIMHLGWSLGFWQAALAEIKGKS